MIVAEFGPEKQRTPDPVVPGKRVGCVFRLETRPLPLDVIEILVADTDVVVLSKLSIEVMDRCPVGSEASDLLRPVAISPICVRQKQRSDG